MTKIGQYVIEAEIGQGGMGTVYRARDKRFDRVVAIKVLHPQFRRDAAFVDRFRSEAVIQAKLAHPNIVSVIDFVADDHVLAMVLEYVEGPSLAEVIKHARGPLPEPRAVRLVDQVLAALGHAHAHGLVHRDVKPSNVVLAKYGDDEVAKVFDFGIAKVLGSDKQKTATGTKMGTLAYMSPEQIRDPRSVDHRADLYGAGVLFYEMLTGRVPFDADTEFGVMQQIVTEPPTLADVPGQHRTVLASLLAKSVGQRPDSAASVRGRIGANSRTLDDANVSRRQRPAPTAPQANEPSDDSVRRLRGRWLFTAKSLTYVGAPILLLGVLLKPGPADNASALVPVGGLTLVVALLAYLRHREDSRPEST